MKSRESLACSFCLARFPYDPFLPFCPDCHEPLSIKYPQKKRRLRLNKNLPLERYLDFLPLEKIDASLSLGEGGTPLLRLSRLGDIPGSPRVLAKNETLNPTHSFKDRGTAVVVQKARALGLDKIGTVSTGNMAASTGAYGARAGLKTFILVKEDTTLEKLLAAAAYGPEVIKVAGDYGELFQKSLSLGKAHGVYFANSVDPVRVEGYKVTGYEVFQDLGGRAPRFLIVPLSSGGHLLGLMRAFLDLKAEGLIPEMPVIVGVQAAGCSPLARAFDAGGLDYERFPNPHTIAHAISNATPPGGRLVLKLIRENKGMILAVTDEDMLEAQRLLAEREGVFCLPDSATTLAGLFELAGRVRLTPEDDVVLLITGTGLKNLEALDPATMKMRTSSLSDLEGILSGLTA